MAGIGEGEREAYIIKGSREAGKEVVGRERRVTQPEMSLSIEH